MSAIPRHVRRTVFQAFSLVMCVLLVATSLPPATQARPAVHETEQPGLRLPLALKEPAAQLTQQGIYTVYLPLVVQNYQPPTPTIAPVSPAAGGVLESADGQVAVSFAPGAVTQTITATYTPLSSIAGIPANQHVVGTAFSLQAQANGVPVARFIPEVVPYTYTNSANHPPLTGYLVTNTVMITMTYSQDQVTGLVEQRLLLHYRDHHNRWVPMLTLVDPQANIAVAPTDHFSDFALLGPTTSTITGTLVILDPDHGGADPGGHVTTPTAYAIEEKTLNLDTALALRDYLETCGVQVLMTREDDSTVAPALRAQFIQQNNPDLALTIAYNVLTTEMSDFFGGPLALADGSKLADWDLGILAADTVYDTTALPINRGVQDARTWRGGVYLPTHVPDTLYTQIELAFIDSYNDRGVIDEQPELFACAAYDTIVTQLELTACLPCSQVRHDERFDRTLGVNQWSRYTAQGVNPVTGNQFQWSRDLFVPGVGLNVDIVRYYNSQTDEAGLFGRGWSSLYDMKLDFLADGAIQVKYADGHRAVFQPGAGGYQAPAGVFEALAAEGGRYVLTTPDQIRFTFDGAGVLQSIADEMDNAITLCYAGVYLDRIEDAGGRIFDVQTDGAGRVTHIIDPSGRVVTYTYGIVSQQCTDYLRGPRGELSTADTPDLLSMTDANGGITGYEYDPTNGYLQYATDPEGITYLDNVYAPDGKVSEQKNGNQDQGSWEYKLEEMQAIFTDNEGNKTTYFFDSKYRVIEEKDALDQSTKYEYDDNDNIIAMTDKQGNTWRYSYDARGNMLTRTDPLDQWSLYDSDVTTWTYDDKNNVTSMTDALGNIWTYKYDDKGNPTEVKEPNGARTTAEYNVKGQMTKLVDAEGRVTEFDYDEHGNRIETRDAEGGWTRSTYDDAGHELARTECLNPPACTRTRTTTNEYDGNGNVTKTIDPMNEKTTFEYDGNNMLKKKVDRRGGIWEYDYDDNLNLKWQKDPLNRIWEYTYNKMDKRLTAKDSLGRITKFQYDDIYRLEKVINPKLDEYNYD
ncbi:MAG: N-acetylmuramoyl-L-alanine amidase, partial [Chloroflexi bacterium]|nr:N-acetylmuramoyl-L-alanine amidase [Chloroflexota bacterium]